MASWQLLPLRKWKVSGNLFAKKNAFEGSNCIPIVVQQNKKLCKLIIWCSWSFMEWFLVKEFLFVGLCRHDSTPPGSGNRAIAGPKVAPCCTPEIQTRAPARLLCQAGLQSLTSLTLTLCFSCRKKNLIMIGIFPCFLKKKNYNVINIGQH